MPLFRSLDHRHKIRALFESELGVIPRSPGSNVFSRSLPVPQQMLRQGVWTVESNRAKSARPSCLYSRRNTCGNSVKKLDITLSLDEVTDHAKKKKIGGVITIIPLMIDPKVCFTTLASWKNKAVESL